MFDPTLIPLVQRLERDPEDQEALQALWKALTDRGEHQTLAVLAEKIALRRRAPASVVDLLHRAAELWSRDLNRDDRAVPLWQKVLEIDPQHELAMAGLAGAWTRAGRIDLAAPLHKRILDRVRDPRARLPILEQIARARAEAGDVAGEVAALQEIVALEIPVAATVEHRRTLARLLVQRGRAAQGDNDADAHPDLREAARLLGSIARDGGTGRAQDFATAALALWPGEETAFSILQATLSMRHTEVTTLRIKFLAANPTSRMASQVRADLADGYLSAGRVDDAIAVLAAAVADDAGAAQRLAKLYERTGRHRDLAMLLASTPLPLERAPRLALLRRRATAWRSAGDRKALLAALREVLGDAPADPEALGEVERDCRLRGDIAELRARFRAAAAVEGTEAPLRARWYRETALLAERAGDLDEAVALWEAMAALLDADEEVDEAYEAIARLLTHGDRWDALLERIAARAKQASDVATRRRWWMRWIDVHRERRNDPAREADVLAAVMADDPQDDRVALALIDAYRRAGRTAEVGEVYRTLVARATPDNAAMRWSQLAGHLELVGDTHGALEAWRQARTLDPSQAMAWLAEERLLEQWGQRGALYEVLVAHAGHPIAAGRRAGELYTRAALLAHELGFSAEAAQLAERALKFSPDDPTLRALVASVPSAPGDGSHDASLEVPSNLLHDVVAGDEAPHDTGEFPAAHLDANDAFAGELTGEHTPAEGMHFEGFAPQVPVLHDGATVEETATRELRALEPRRATTTGEHPVVVATIEEAETRELQALDAPEAEKPDDPRSTRPPEDDFGVEHPTRERPVIEPAPPEEPDVLDDRAAAAHTGEHPIAAAATPRTEPAPELPPPPDEPPAPTTTPAPSPPEALQIDAEEEEPTRPLSAVVKEVHAQLRASQVPPVAREAAPPPTSTESDDEIDTADLIPVEVDLTALEAPSEETPAPEARVSNPPPPPPEARVSNPPPPPPETRASVPPPEPPSKPADTPKPSSEALPSIIVDDSLLGAASPPSVAPPIQKAPSQRVAPVSAPVQAPPPSAAAPKPLPTLPPLAATGFVAQKGALPVPLAPLSMNAPVGPPAPLPPLTMVAPLAPPLAPPPGASLLGAPLPSAPLAPPLAPPPGSPLAPLAAPPGSPWAPVQGSVAPLNNLGFVNASPAPAPLNYMAAAPGDPFASNSDPFASMSAPPAGAAFVAPPPNVAFVAAGAASSDPFASTARPVLTPAQPLPPAQPAPPQAEAPPPPTSAVVYQKVMAAMFEQAVASLRG